jgi:glycine/D-amino acid oxidase-like deaminating enzyme
MKVLRDFRRGRSQRLLSALTAASALPLGVEIHVNHYGGSFWSSASRVASSPAEHGPHFCDGSVMPTQGSANPAPTIMALASRLAERTP